MLDLAKLRTDKGKIANGVWVKDVLPEIDVQLISTSSVEFKKFAQAQMKPYTALGMEPTVEESEKIGAKTFAYCAVKDWRGVMLDGIEIPFSPEKAMEIFLEIPEFLTAVVKASASLENFRSASLENIAKN